MMKTRARKLSDGYIRVEYGLRTIGKQKPYFSVTALMWNSLAHARRWPDNAHSAGCLHEEVLRAWPGMADIVALHLSDSDGVPMHGVANGWYWYGQGDLDATARHLRVSVTDLPVDADREAFATYVDAQRVRWAAEAHAVRAKYNLDIATEAN